MKNYFLSDDAFHDLAEISVYTADQWGEAQEAKYIGQLYRRLEAIGKNSRIGRDCSYLHPGLRCVEEGSHVIYFREVEEEVEIVRVLHRRMLPGRHLN